MQHRTPEECVEIATFIIEGTHRLATISMNDYGFQLSARMAQTYLQRALHILESKQSFDRCLTDEIGTLKTVAGAITCEYAQFEKFCIDCERFNHQETKDAIEWVSKWIVRAISRSYLGTVSHHLAHKICAFHSRVCSVLVDA